MKQTATIPVTADEPIPFTITAAGREVLASRAVLTAVCSELNRVQTSLWCNQPDAAEALEPLRELLEAAMQTPNCPGCGEPIAFCSCDLPEPTVGNRSI